MDISIARSRAVSTRASQVKKMDFSRAITEPLVRLIAFHNAFNLNVKFVYGALACLDTNDADAACFTLPNGGEPWGDNISWRNLDAAVQTAAAFISEMGVVRSASSFEDYVTGATAELDRASARVAGTAASTSGSSADEEAFDDDVPQLYPLLSRLGLDPENMAADLTLVKFFQIARNCVVHRSGRASPALAEISRSEELAAALKTWPRRKGKWLLAIPQIEKGEACFLAAATCDYGISLPSQMRHPNRHRPHTGYRRRRDSFDGRSLVLSSG